MSQMSVREILAAAARFQPNGPAGEDVVDGLERWLRQTLPGDYREFIIVANGGKGTLGTNPVFFERAEQLLAWNDQLGGLVTDFVLIGSDCIGGGYFLHRRTGLRSVVHMELIDLDLGRVIQRGATFTEFLLGLVAS